jgi:hypothetical protein
MGYTPITLPTNANLDRSQSEDPPTTPRLLGAATEFVDTMQQLPLADLTSHMVGLYDEKYNPGRFMNFNEIKEAYPLVADQFKDGGHENLIRDINDKKHKELYNQNIINNMQPGALSGLTKFAGFGIANAMSPTNYLAGFGVEATVGKFGAMIASKIPETNIAAKFAARAGFGVTEGGLAVTPIALSTSDYYKQIGMPISAWDTAKMIGFGAGLGGILRTAIGFKNPIAPEAHENAFAVAQDQMAAGKKVDVGLVVKDGNYKARNLEDPADVEALNVIRDDMQKKVSDLSEKIEKEKKNFEELSKDKEVSPLEKITDGREIVDRAERLNRIPEELRTAEENSFMKSLPDTDEIKAALTFKNISRDELLPKEQKFLDRFENGEEPEMLKKNIASRETEIERLKKQIKKIKEPSKEEEIHRLSKIQERNKRQIGRAKSEIESLKKKKFKNVALKKEALSGLKRDIKTLEDENINVSKKITETQKAQKVVKELSPAEEERIDDFKKQIDETNKRLEEGKERLKELRKFEREPEKVKTSRAKIRELEREQAARQKMVEDTDAHIALLNTESNPVNVPELKAGAEQVNSWKGEDTTNLSDFKEAEEEAARPETSEKELLDAYQNTVDNLEKAGDLGKVEKDALSELKTEEAKQTKINDALRDQIVCEINVEGS